MRGLDYVLRKGIELRRPVAVNISIGNTYGSHDGDSLLETFIDEAAGFSSNCIVIGSGNEGGTAGHYAGTLAAPGARGMRAARRWKCPSAFMRRFVGAALEILCG